MEKMNVTVVIPSLNPDEKLMRTICELEANGFNDIIVVNDGSDVKYRGNFPTVEEHPGCSVITHRRNRGKGAALKSAFQHFLNYHEGKDGIVTVDGDGQHSIDDIINCVKTMCETGKVVLGSRDFSGADVPTRSKIGNRTTRFVFRMFCGIKISDTQTGLRAIPTEYVGDLLEAKGTRYEYETNMLLEFKKQHIPFIEVPIKTIYEDGNITSHFRPFVDSVRIYKFVFAFVFSSLLSMFIELIMFYLLLEFFITGSYDVVLATIIARFVSSTVNFSLNRSQVFGGKEKLSKTLTRYIILAIPLAACSMLCIEGLVALFGGHAAYLKTIFKMIVDTTLFFVSFRIQQNWVFASHNTHELHENNEVAPKKSKKKLTLGKVLRRFFACFGTTVLCLVLSVLVLLTVIARGPSTTLRDALVLSAMQASATKWVPGLFLSDETVQQIVDNSYVDNRLTIDMDDYTDGSNDTEDEFKDAVDGVKYISTRYDNFKAYIMLVPDPERVYVGVSSDNFASAARGLTIFDLAKKENCIAAINGGEFVDEGGNGRGGAPTGLTYSNGNCVWNDGTRRTFIGIDNNNRLVVAESMTKAKADSLGVRDGVSFKTGNVLIDSDSSGVHIHYKQGNTGAAQRTAIGQRADGTFILIVTDGRTASSLGATYNEIIDIMVSYGAVTAAMLDGGSSAMMYYEDYYDKYNVDKSTLDKYQLQGLANRYKAFSPPRTIPTFFCVSR